MHVGTVIALPIAAAGSDPSELPGSSAVLMVVLLLLFVAAFWLIWDFRAMPVKSWPMAFTIVGVFCVISGCFYLHTSSQKEARVEIKKAAIEAQTQLERAKIEDEMREKLTPEITLKVQTTVSLKNLIKSLTEVKTGLTRESALMMERLQSKKVDYDKVESLKIEWLKIKAFLQPEHSYCIKSEEIIGRSEAPQVTSTLGAMLKDIELSLYPEYYEAQADRVLVEDNQPLPQRPVIDAPKVWQRRIETLKKITDTHLPAVNDLLKQLQEKLDKLESPPRDGSIKDIK